MSEANWQTALTFVLSQEGGYSDDPRDPGGITNRGITISEWQRWTGCAVTADDMKSLTVADVTPVYHSSYWLASRCADMPAGVDLLLFDMSVNTGNRRAAIMLQDAVGAAPVDGIIGPITLAAVRAESASWLIGQLSTAREEFYRSLSTFPHFGNGWLNRVAAAKTAALALI